MKGIIITKEQFDSLPVSYSDRLLLVKQKDGLIGLVDIDGIILGKTISFLLHEPPMPVVTKDNIVSMVYPDWTGDTFEWNPKKTI